MDKFEYISHLFAVSLSLTLNRQVFDGSGCVLDISLIYAWKLQIKGCHWNGVTLLNMWENIIAKTNVDTLAFQ